MFAKLYVYVGCFKVLSEGNTSSKIMYFVLAPSEMALAEFVFSFFFLLYFGDFCMGKSYATVPTLLDLKSSRFLTAVALNQ